MQTVTKDPRQISDSGIRSQIRSKLEMPRSSADQITRPEVVRRINEGHWAPLTVVFAPSGYGKTSILSDCCRRLSQRGTRVAWLTLDSADNDLGRFLTCLNECMQRLVETGQTAGQTGFGTDEEKAAALLETVGRASEPFAIFLDEGEHLTEWPVLEFLRELVDVLPSHGRIILATRSLPELRLPMLRARGKLLELNQTDLQFSVDETLEFLSKGQQSALSVVDVQKINDRTEGWPLALRLVRMLIERGTDLGKVLPQLTGSNSALSEFLANEVFDAQSSEIQDFLLRTSVLKDLNPELCDRIYEPGNSAEILLDLMRKNVFVSQIEGADGLLYRYHGLFLRYLKDRAKRDHPDLIAGLHRAAMEWHIEQGREVRAIDHAIRGGDTESAISLLSRVGRALLRQGRFRLLNQCFGALPKEMINAQPDLMLQQAWAVLFSEGPKKAHSLIDNQVWTHSSSMNVEALCLRMQLLSFMDDFDSAIEVGVQALPDVDEVDSYVATVFLNALGYAYFIKGRYVATRKTLQQARSLNPEDDDVFNVMFAESVQGLIDLMESRLREATARFRVAAGTTRSGARHKTNGNLMAGIPLACCYYEANDLQRAETQLRFHLPFVREVGPIDHLVLCYVMLARIAFVNGDLDQTFYYLAELEELGLRQGLTRVSHGARLERARIYMRLAQYDLARKEIVNTADDDLWKRVEGEHLIASDLETPALHQIRVELLDGDPQTARDMIEPHLRQCREQNRLRRALVLGLLDCAALNRMGNLAEAKPKLERLLHQCASEGYLRIILDEGPAVAEAIQAYAQGALQGNRAMRDPLFVDWLQELLTLFPTPPVATQEDLGLPLEPLTPKELEILELLNQGFSNSDISDALSVSNSTVRTHLRNINSKMDVSSRGQAVAIGRKIGLLQ
ncbi:LuxR C-terminal-related transcriptional regulator [Ruegeria sp.]|uniref:LuxR C-terminal-related transcriptional regulator n=1 Tax=Ruegeria sp. TaxID=1879320 RepID=UPI003B5BDDDA